MPKVIDLPTSTSMSDSDYFIMEASGGGTKKITKQSAIKPTGTYISATNSSALSVSSGTYTNLLSISITKGIWIISANVRMSGGGSGGMIIAGISDVSKDAQGGSNTSYTAIPASADNRSISMSRIYATGTTKTIYLVGFQSSGSAKTAGANQCMIRAVCLSESYTAG